MTITYRKEKGSPLTVQEIDNNFKELETRLNALEEHSEDVEGLGKIHVEGDQLHFQGTFGKDFGTFTLPQATLNPRGPWIPQTPYKKLDLVTFANALYYCMEDHQATAWDEDKPFWKLILSLPPPPSSTLPLYEKASLPETETIGKLALLLEAEGTSLIFFNGKTWQQLESKEKTYD